MLAIITPAAALQPVDDLRPAELLDTVGGADRCREREELSTCYRPPPPHADRRALHTCKISDILHVQCWWSAVHGAPSFGFSAYSDDSRCSLVNNMFADKPQIGRAAGRERS